MKCIKENFFYTSYFNGWDKYKAHTDSFLILLDEMNNVSVQDMSMYLIQAAFVLLDVILQL